MIVDQLSNAAWYGGLPATLRMGLEYLTSHDLETLELGRHDIDGDRVFALVQEYPTREENECRWEAHRRYYDIQVVARGVERIGVAPLANVSETMAYDETKDVAFFAGEGDWLTMSPGRFAIFAPGDVHRPCVRLSTITAVRKIVIKCATGA